MICVWNVKGVGRKCFSRTIADLKMVYHFDILVILEPRISGSRAANVIKKLFFSNSFIVDAKVFLGGLWLLWNNNNVRVHVIAKSKHTITTLVADQHKIWVFTVVYASPCVTSRKVFWNYLDAIRNFFNLP